MRIVHLGAGFACVAGGLSIGCASSREASASPDTVQTEQSSDDVEGDAELLDDTSDETTNDSASAPQEPHFTPGMSVVEATNAVPSTTQRLNIEQEALAEPLMDPKLYEPCALRGNQHFQLRVAVWDGRAVGLDVTTKPVDAKLEACLRQQIAGVEWKDKAKSINTVEYSF
jgi:hypothetical protein